MRKIQAIILVLIMIALTNSASAKDDAFSRGCDEYAKGNYAVAKGFFLSELHAHPTNWQADYQLANTLVQLKDYAGARNSYQSCLQLNPDPVIGGYCRTAMAQIDKTIAAASTPIPAPAIPDEVKAAQQKTKQSTEEKTVNAAYEQRKKEIMEGARKDCERIKAEGQERLTEAKESSNLRYIDPNGGFTTDITPDEKARINHETDEKVERVMEEARRQIDMLPKQ